MVEEYMQKGLNSSGWITLTQKAHVGSLVGLDGK